jgi:tetratricopeptide (TPR) repeat protein
MCKPMLVTLPFVLLLLDFWPLRRVHLPIHRSTNASIHQSINPLPRLVVEKLPFFALSVASSAITFIVQREGGAVSGLGVVSAYPRVGNALLAYVRYLGKILWPANLAPMYPLLDALPLLIVACTALVLAAVTGFVVRRARVQPYLLTGWFWFLGTLVPAIGLVQVGPQAMADRYLYIPSIGLFLLLIWGLADLLRSARPNVLLSRPLPWGGSAALAAPALLACLVCTFFQTRYWHDGETLYRHSLQATGPNYIVCDYLGIALQEAGKTEEALASLTESVLLAPRYGEGRYNLGTALLEKGRLDEAVVHLKAAVKLSSTDGNAHHNLGNAYLRRHQLQEAIVELAHAAALKPDDAAVRLTLGSALLDQGRLEEAAIVLSDALRLAPDNAEAHRSLGVALVRQGKAKEALRQFAEAVRLGPHDPELRFQLGLALLDQDRPEEAAAQFAAGLRFNANDPKTHYRLGVALSRQHKAEEAIFHFREALRLHPDFPEARSGLALTLASDTNPQE